MGVSIAKSKKTAKAVVKKKPVEKPGTIYGYEEAVDRVAQIDAELAAIPSVSDKLKEKAKLEKQLREVADQNVSPEENATLVGTKKNYCVSAKSVQRSIPSMIAVRDEMGPALFMEVASVSLGDIDKYLSEEQKKRVLVEARTGPRRGELVDKG